MLVKKEDQGLYLPVERKIGACLTRRTEIIWIEASSTKEEIKSVLKQHTGYNLFPVCSGTIDTVLGVLETKDFFESLCETEWVGLKELVQKPIYLPETVTIAKTLAILKDNTSKMAFIIDEYGGIEGIVTKNGLINNLLENIKPEDKKKSSILITQSENTWLVNAQARIDEVSTIIKLPEIENSDKDYYTLAGYLLTINENIPKKGDSINYKNYNFTITAMDGNRIDQVLITKRS